MKNCTACGSSKPFSEFSRHARMKGGMQTQCKACCATYNAAWQAKNKAKVQSYLTGYYLANKEKLKARSNANRKANPARALAYDLARRKANPGRCRGSKAAWEKRNPAAMVAKAAKRRAALLYGQPPWIGCYSAEMKAFYRECRLAGLTGDHIVPLLGKSVCGLHVPWNMQMLSRVENSRKSNRLLSCS